MIYTAWGKSGYANCLHKGTRQPCFVDGTLDDECPELIWTIEADSWEEACRQYHELQGWEPYKSELEVAYARIATLEALLGRAGKALKPMMPVVYETTVTGYHISGAARLEAKAVRDDILKALGRETS